METGENRRNGFYFDYNPDSELYGSGNVDYGHKLAEFMEKDKIEFSEPVKPREENKLEKSLRLLRNLSSREDVGIPEKRSVLSRVRKWGCYTTNESPWEMDSKQVEVFFKDALKYLNKKLNKSKQDLENRNSKYSF